MRSEWGPAVRARARRPGQLGAGLVVRSGDGEVEMASFVVVVWKVFEDFVTTALSEALARVPGRTQAQLPAFLELPGAWGDGVAPA